jgi:hypothetical protein
MKSQNGTFGEEKHAMGLLRKNGEAIKQKNWPNYVSAGPFFSSSTFYPFGR